MVFENPSAFWLLLVIPLLLIFGFWGWKVKKEMVKIWFAEKKAKNRQVIKYILATAIILTLIFAVAYPKIPFPLPENAVKTGDVIFMVDVSASMAAEKDLDSLNRLERVKLMLHELIDKFPEAKFYPFHFTSIARSLTPPLTKEDFPYLKRSIARVLDINSLPGEGSSFGKPISQVLKKISKDERVKIIVLFSDGEFYGSSMQDSNLEPALKEAVQMGVKIVTVGVGEKEGAKIPLYDQEGEFTGDFAADKGKVFVTYLEEENLKLIASRTQGKYFFEEDYKGVVDFLNKNLEDSVGSQDRDYRDMGYLLILPIAALWIIFARFYLK